MPKYRLTPGKEPAPWTVTGSHVRTRRDLGAQHTGPAFALIRGTTEPTAQVTLRASAWDPAGRPEYFCAERQNISVRSRGYARESQAARMAPAISSASRKVRWPL
jgi:hypothetical protein